MYIFQMLQDSSGSILPLNTWADGSAENAPEISWFYSNAGIAADVANTAIQMFLLSFMA